MFGVRPFFLVLLQGNREEGGEDRERAREDAQVRHPIPPPPSPCPVTPADFFPCQPWLSGSEEGAWQGRAGVTG